MEGSKVGLGTLGGLRGLKRLAPGFLRVLGRLIVGK
jgi:hypothetical protein